MIDFQAWATSACNAAGSINNYVQDVPYAGRVWSIARDYVAQPVAALIATVRATVQPHFSKAVNWTIANKGTVTGIALTAVGLFIAGRFYFRPVDLTKKLADAKKDRDAQVDVVEQLKTALNSANSAVPTKEIYDEAHADYKAKKTAADNAELVANAALDAIPERIHPEYLAKKKIADDAELVAADALKAVPADVNDAEYETKKTASDDAALAAKTAREAVPAEVHPEYLDKKKIASEATKALRDAQAAIPRKAHPEYAEKTEVAKNAEAAHKAAELQLNVLKQAVEAAQKAVRDQPKKP